MICTETRCILPTDFKADRCMRARICEQGEVPKSSLLSLGPCGLVRVWVPGPGPDPDLGRDPGPGPCPGPVAVRVPVWVPVPVGW